MPLFISITVQARPVSQPSSSLQCSHQSQFVMTHPVSHLPDVTLSRVQQPSLTRTVLIFSKSSFILWVHQFWGPATTDEEKDRSCSGSAEVKPFLISSLNIPGCLNIFRRYYHQGSISTTIRSKLNQQSLIFMMNLVSFIWSFIHSLFLFSYQKLSICFPSRNLV